MNEIIYGNNDLEIAKETVKKYCIEHNVEVKKELEFSEWIENYIGISWNEWEEVNKNGSDSDKEEIKEICEEYDNYCIKINAQFLENKAIELLKGIKYKELEINDEKELAKYCYEEMEIEDKLIYERENIRIFETDEIFCNNSYYSPERNKIAKAIITIDLQEDKIILSFQDEGKELNAKEIMQTFWNSTEVDGKEDIAKSPKLTCDKFFADINSKKEFLENKAANLFAEVEDRYYKIKVKEQKMKKNKVTKAVEDKLVFEDKNIRVFETDGIFCNDSYYSPEQDSITKAIISINTKTNSIKLSFKDGGKELNAEEIVQSIWGPEASGRKGVANSPRGAFVQEAKNETNFLKIEAMRLFNEVKDRYRELNLEKDNNKESFNHNKNDDFDR